MTHRKQALKLTWTGKENRPRLEPRVLVEDPALSYHARERVTEKDLFDNMLIQAANLLALKALEQEDVCIAPHYAAGNAFAQDEISKSVRFT